MSHTILQVYTNNDDRCPLQIADNCNVQSLELTVLKAFTKRMISVLCYMVTYEGHSKSFATWHDNVKMSMHAMYQ